MKYRAAHGFRRGIAGDFFVFKVAAAAAEKGLDEAVLKKIAALNELALQRHQTLAQMAIAWLLKDKRISSVLVGASSSAQLLNSIASVKNIDFSAEELNAIETILQ